MSRSWLQRKRKVELIDLAQQARLPDADAYLKDDLVDLLEEHLNANESTYAKQAGFRDFYGRSGSPVKRERFSPTAPSTETKSRRRTIVNAVADNAAQAKETSKSLDKSLITRTPRAVSHRVSQVFSEVELPQSPAQLVEVADQSFQVVKAKATDFWERSQVDYFKDVCRESASSVATIQMLILLIEAAGLQLNTLQRTNVNVYDPVAQRTGYSTFLIPDFSTLLTSNWWAPATLWSLTSWFLPLVFSYFFNLTLRSNTNRKTSDRQYASDPVTFNIAKSILTYTAYRMHVVQPGLVGEPGIATIVDYSWGPFSPETVGVVRDNIPGGFNGMQIGAWVGIVLSLYDAVLRR